jgi:hypothetical protein
MGSDDTKEPEFDVEQRQSDTKEWRRAYCQCLVTATRIAKDIAKALAEEETAARRGGTTLGGQGVYDLTRVVDELVDTVAAYGTRRWPFSD